MPCPVPVSSVPRYRALPLGPIIRPPGALCLQAFLGAPTGECPWAQLALSLAHNSDKVPGLSGPDEDAEAGRTRQRHLSAGFTLWPRWQRHISLPNVGTMQRFSACGCSKPGTGWARGGQAATCVPLKRAARPQGHSQSPPGWGLGLGTFLCRGVVWAHVPSGPVRPQSTSPSWGEDAGSLKPGRVERSWISRLDK